MPAVSDAQRKPQIHLAGGLPTDPPVFQGDFLQHHHHLARWHPQGGQKLGNPLVEGFWPGSSGPERSASGPARISRIAWGASPMPLRLADRWCGCGRGRGCGSIRPGPGGQPLRWRAPPRRPSDRTRKREQWAWPSNLPPPLGEPQPPALATFPACDEPPCEPSSSCPGWPWRPTPPGTSRPV